MANNLPPRYSPSLTGPDTILNAYSFTSSKLNQPVKLRLSEVDMEKYPPLSVYTMFKRTVEKMPHHNALAFKATNSQSQWAYFTYEEYWKICNKAAKSFIKVHIRIFM